MVAQVDMVNEALQKLGTRTTVTAAQLAANTGSNEAIQSNIIYDRTRKRLLRMAPWNCAFNTTNLTLITAAPGTPENTSAATQLWQKGQPAPPWAYEYQRPSDCLYAAWLTPNTATGFAGGVPITTAVTGGAPSFWQGPPVKWKAAIDQFYVCTGYSGLFSGGVGYAVGDLIVMAGQPAVVVLNNILGNFQVGAPQGAAPILQVTSVDGSGAVTSAVLVGPIANISGTQQIISGAYFYPNTGHSLQASTTGAGTGIQAALNFTAPIDQNVILTNQEFAVLNYIRDISDVNLFDDLFTSAFTSILGASLNMALAGDKKLSNMLIALANDDIGKARGRDGNEGLTVNDVTPDWIRVRGISYIEDYSGPFDSGYNWGGVWPGYS